MDSWTRLPPSGWSCCSYWTANSLKPPKIRMPSLTIFNRIKGLTLLGYFTSEIGYTQALRYIETPGRYDPCVDYVAGERLWARHA